MGGMNLMEDIMSLSGTSWEIPVNKMDKIFTSEAGGAIYVGGWEAAENLTLLQTANIKGVVNCTTDLYNKPGNTVSISNSTSPPGRTLQRTSQKMLATLS